MKKVKTHKRCPHCKILKKIKEYYVCKGRKYGSPWCMLCTRELGRKIHRRNSVARLKANRIWCVLNRSTRTKYNRKWRKKNKISHTISKRKSNSKWCKLNKHKINAGKQARRAVRTGELIKLPCQICGNKKVEGHHCDYSQPLKVMWLCKKHHEAWHRVFTPESP